MNYFGMLADVALVLWFPACGFIGHWYGGKVRREMAARRPFLVAEPVAPTPHHVHILDMDRSQISVTDAGGIHARCCVAGCGEPVYVAPNLSRMYIAETTEA
jgi:hypothetical protein